MSKPLNYRYYFALLLCLLIALPSLAALTPEQEAAKQKGIQMYQRYQNTDEATDSLLIAAEAGDVEAMVYLGIVYKVTMPLLSGKWLEKAANQGDIYAMYQLSLDGAVWDQFGLSESKNKTNWKQKGVEASLAKAKQGDPEAMYVYYRFTGNLEWLKKAADLGYLPAQESVVPNVYANEPPFDKFSKQEQDRLFMQYAKRAIDNGSPKIMYTMVLRYESDNESIPKPNQQSAQNYLLQAVEKGYIPAIEYYIYALEDSKTYQKLGLKPNSVKAYAFTALLIDNGIKSSGDLNFYKDGITTLDGRYITPLSPEQIKQAELFKERWAKTHPPLTNGSNKLTNVNATNEYE